MWVPYERYEYTRLSDIRKEMDQHRTYKKEDMDLGTEEDDEFIKKEDPSQETSGADQSQSKKKKKDSYIWTFLIRPIHEDDGKKWPDNFNVPICTDI